MAVSINPMMFIGTFLIFLTEFGSGLRVVTQPQPFTDLTNELNISCIADKPTYQEKSIMSIQIMRHIEDKVIASVNMEQKLKKGDGFKDDFQVQGHIDAESNTGYLALIIDKPHSQNAGIYRCQMFVLDDSSQIIEKNVIGNVTYQEEDITGVITHLARKVSRLSKTVIKLNNTQHTQKKQHVSFRDFYSQLKLVTDILADKIDTENMTNTEQNNELEELKDHEARQKQDYEILTDTMERQAKQIEVLTKDNKQKQKQLDMLIAYIQRQNETNKDHESRLQSMANKIGDLHYPEWKFYQADQTFVKAFGKKDLNKGDTWFKARESCQTYGGDLVQIHDEAKNKFVFDLFDGARYGHPWIGLNNAAILGFEFKYVDGSNLGSYHPWVPGFPAGTTDNDRKCVTMSTSTSNHPGKWYDTPCSEIQPYVCSVTTLI